MKAYTALFFFVVWTTCACGATIGEQYVGAKYVNNPLGEGCLPDADPLMRLDAFDCTTFVETALADTDLNKLTKIRYKDGVVDFVNRNHFVETDWLPNNSDILTDVTRKYGKTSTRDVRIDRANWLKKNYNIDDETPVQTVHLKYIPYSVLEKINTTEPLVVLFIGDKYKDTDTLGTDLAVMHMGFLLPDGTLRHASSDRGRIVDVNFYDYVAKRKKSPNNLGIMLLEPKK
ncbi:MAG: DUF1460 domain-containing protein [Alphaproteobacteria bacterium]|nr:DUF1460 domain-containing protein [Alphaproteobacteria bacterium]